MSVRNGRPVGRVVVDYGVMVIIIHRDRLSSVLLDKNVEVSWRYVGGVEEYIAAGPDQAELYSSIVNEDVDVVWSQDTDPPIWHATPWGSG